MRAERGAERGAGFAVAEDDRGRERVAKEAEGEIGVARD